MCGRVLRLAATILPFVGPFGLDLAPNDDLAKPAAGEALEVPVEFFNLVLHRRNVSNSLFRVLNR